MIPNRYKLFWEDIAERVVFAELDDYAWKIPEQFFGYQKENSLYIFHSGKLAAYYSIKDAEQESKIGYRYYSQSRNYDKVIQLKRNVWQKVKNYSKNLDLSHLNQWPEAKLKKVILKTLDLFREALGTHYLTQPQFFQKFEQQNSPLPKNALAKISIARFKYTRAAWSQAMKICRILLAEYGERHNLRPEQAESLFYGEIKNDRISKRNVVARVNKFVLESIHHKVKLYVGNSADGFITKCEQYKNLKLVKGIVGNKGFKKGRVFVVKNEFLDLNRLPSGMRKGMILVVQNAWPEFAPLYKLASAIVTNEGGITSHGVVVAREMKIPCVVATKIATKIFKTDDLIEVDANKGMVRIIKRE